MVSIGEWKRVTILPRLWSQGFPQLKLSDIRHQADRISQLSLAYGYHSPAMGPRGRRSSSPSKEDKGSSAFSVRHLYVLGQVVIPGDLSSFTSDYFVRHCVEPVRFYSRNTFICIDRKLAFGGNDLDRAWSPSTHFTHVYKNFPDLSGFYVFLVLFGKDRIPGQQLSKTLCSLYLTDKSLDWRRVFSQNWIYFLH